MKRVLLTLFTALTTVLSFAQGTETFTNMPANATSYAVRTWTGDNGLTWTANDARTDQSINGRAIGLRNSTLSSANIPNGISELSFKYKYLFTGSAAVLSIRVNGNEVGTLTVPSSATTAATATFSNINVSGAFNLDIVETVTGARVAIDDLSWTASSTTTCTTPTAQPTALTLGTVTNTSISANFTASSPAANSYLVVISTSNTLAGAPQNQATYTEGDVIGNGTVVSAGAGTSFTASSLSPGTTYYFYIFSFNNACSGGPLYNTTSPLTGSAATTAPPACTTPAAPATPSLTSGNTSVTGSIATTSGTEGYMVIENSTGNLQFTPANGTTYAVGQTVGTNGNTGRVVKYSEGGTFASFGLTPNTRYFYFVYGVNGFNCTGGPLYSNSISEASIFTTNSSSGIPTGYYDTVANQSCASLKDVLKWRTTAGMTPKTYSDLWSQYLVSDVKPREVGPGTSSMVIWDIYSDVPNGPDPYNFTPGTVASGGQQDNGTLGSAEGERYNREHSVPLSWFSGNTGTPGPATDYHHLFPTDKFVNNQRSSYIYGEVDVPTFTSRNGSMLGNSAIGGFTGPVFEPIDEYKGDVARAFLYFVTRYQDNMPEFTGGQNGEQAFDQTTFPSVDIPYLQLMLKWHNEDAVSQKEIDRNNAAYSFQGNRNPYVDHPEYATRVWNSTCTGLSALPVNIVLFKGKLTGETVQLEWLAENEINFDRYEVERSFNGINYKQIGVVSASNIRNYSYNDDATTLKGQRVYYRLKSVDKNGTSKYSTVYTLHVPNNTRFSIYPNPANSYMQLQFNQTLNGTASIQVADVLGKVYQQHNLKVNGSTINLSTEGLTSGTYLVKLVYNGEQYIQKVMVVK